MGGKEGGIKPGETRWCGKADGGDQSGLVSALFQSCGKAQAGLPWWHVFCSWGALEIRLLPSWEAGLELGDVL